ncbi:DUF6701 domain-containing protein [Aeromonas allosaccharophila]|uniref:DUF6701 domain-containing protein n=1 Tax=Aeromonas allosaccharophila TaxID=656 RepID=UPI001EF94F48|nr:DUF6701 domain-containing protein [Aeromonas allosaccharophila]
MMLRSSAYFLSALVWCSASVQAASQCTAAFAYPVQSHASPGLLAMSGESKIVSATMNTNYPFLGKTIQPNANCNNGGYWNGGTWISTCNVSGTLANSLKALEFIPDPKDFPVNPSDFPSYSGQGDLSCNGAISPAAGNYKSASWAGSSCVATLRSGKTYRFNTLSLAEGAVLNLNGATVYAKKLTISNGYNTGFTGVGNLHVNELAITGGGKLADASVTVYSSLEVSDNGSTGTAIFQPHYIENVTMNVSASGQSVLMAAGNWFIKNLLMESNSAMTFQGKGSLGVYELNMKDQSRVKAAGDRSDLNVKLYQTLDMSGNAVIDGYLDAHYLKRLVRNSTSDIILYFSGGSHWIDELLLGINDELVFDSGAAAQLYINRDLALTSQMEINVAGNANDLMMYNFGSITMGDNAKLNAILYVKTGDLDMSGQAQLTGAVSAVNVTMTNNSKVIHEPFNSDWPEICEEDCFSDDFPAGSLSSSWVVAQRNNSTLPSIQNGRLRLTENATNQATSTTFQRLFPGSNNLVTVEFDHYAYKTSGTSGADGMAVVLSDATITPQPGAFGGPLGYGFKTGISGFAGGWLGIGLDEYGNFANEGGSSNLGSLPQAVSIRGSGSGTSGYNYLSGSSSKLSPAVDSGTNSARPHSYRITVDSRVIGSSMATVERNTGSGYVKLIGPINMVRSGQAAVPENFLLSLTGSTGSVTNFHEIDNFRVCALRSNPIGVQIDHFQLDHSGQPLTCNPETVTVKACANAACTTLITDPVTATLSLTPTSASNGWIGGNTVTFSGGSTTVQLRNNTPTAVTIGVSGSTPTTKPFSTTLCKAGAGTPSAAACTLNFADSGFFFDVPDTYSNQPQTVTIKAVKKSDVTKQCVPGFASQTKSVKFWSSYISPASNPYNSNMSVNNSVLGTSQGTATPLSLVFDAQGQSTITVNYPDAGKVQLDARYDGTGSEAGLVMLGADQFVARPVGLCITPPQGICAAGNSSCPVFKKAGETFQIDIKAMAWESANDGDICAGNQTTPNFALPNIALGSTLVAPNPGTNATLGTTTYGHVAAANSANNVSQTVSEVGVFRMTATPPVNGYFNYTIPSAQSQPVGRFVPWDFNLLSGVLTPACGQFSYMSQPFGIKMMVQARNKSAGVTRNYGGEFAKGLLYLVAGNNHDGVDRTDRVARTTFNWVSGEANVDSQSRFARLSEREPVLAAPEEPFKLLRFGLQVVDGESPSVSFMADADLNPVIKNGCTKGVNCNARQLTIPTRGDNTMTAYYGRLLAGTEAGVASAPLAIPLKMQYYEAGNWQPNKEDQCTRLSLAADGIRFLNPGHSFDAATRDLNLGAGRKIKLGLGSSAPGGDAAQAKDGEILFHFAKPDISVRIPYKVDLAKQPLSPLWLSDPASTNDGNLQGEAIFGSSRGNDRIIYRREVLQ